MENHSHRAYFISKWTYDHLVEWGVSEAWASHINSILLLVSVIIVVYIVQHLAKYILRLIFTKIGKVTRISFFNYLINNKFHKNLALALPYTIVKESIPLIFADFHAWIKPLSSLVEIYFIFLVISIFMSIIRAGADVLREKPAFRDKPMASYLQIIRITLSFIGCIIAFTVVTGKSPTAFFAVIGTASALLMLMFKDSIMGFVASIQVTTNDMVRIGDWITVPKYGADGDVLEINLTTVKVQNFDMTITTLPTYALISDSFQNWRGMKDAGGRRIKRSIHIKQSSIRYISDNELERFKKIQGLAAYIDERHAEIAAHNERIKADRNILINGRNFTNAGLFRKYAEWYLKNHPGTSKDMTLMVRQLAPTDIGLPMELYVFAGTIEWAKYEGVMADIFDHLIAAVPYFDLQIFERESSTDIRKIEFSNPLSVGKE